MTCYRITPELLAGGPVTFHADPSAPQPERPAPRCRHLGEPIGEYPPRDGLGDAVERGLSALGVTKERWARLKHAAGWTDDPNDCGGCTGRQIALNKLGAAVGIGTDPERRRLLERLLRLEAGKTATVHGCAIHGECLRGLGVEIAGAPIGCVRCRREGLGWEAT